MVMLYVSAVSVVVVMVVVHHSLDNSVVDISVQLFCSQRSLLS